MFKNRSIQVKFVDDRKAALPIAPAEPAQPLETQIIEVVRHSSKYAMMLVGAYMAADTLRQVTIYTACQKIK